MIGTEFCWGKQNVSGCFVTLCLYTIHLGIMQKCCQEIFSLDNVEEIPQPKRWKKQTKTYIGGQLFPCSIWWTDTRYLFMGENHSTTFDKSKSFFSFKLYYNILRSNRVSYTRKIGESSNRVIHFILLYECILDA